MKNLAYEHSSVSLNRGIKKGGDDQNRTRTTSQPASILARRIGPLELCVAS